MGGVGRECTFVLDDFVESKHQIIQSIDDGIELFRCVLELKAFRRIGDWNFADLFRKFIEWPQVSANDEVGDDEKQPGGDNAGTDEEIAETGKCGNDWLAGDRDAQVEINGWILPIFIGGLKAYGNHPTWLSVGEPDHLKHRFADLVGQISGLWEAGFAKVHCLLAGVGEAQKP